MLKIIFALFAFITSFCNFISAGECREVVFVLNAGQSMNTSDSLGIAREGIIWGTQNLYAEDEVGIVTFQDEAAVIRPLSNVGDNPATNFSVNYYGRSNAGAGILTAIDILSPKFNTQRDIIFITNGEISDAQSSANFKAGLTQAKWLGISVYLIDLRYNADPKNYNEYDTVKFLPINYNELLTTIRTILQGDFKTPHIAMPTYNIMHDSLKFSVPITSPESLKISLFSIKPGNAHFKNIQTTESFQGNFVKIFDVNSPATNSFEIDIDYPQGSGIALDVVAKVAGTFQTKQTTKFLIKDILEITPVYKNSPDSKILSDNFFDGKRINLRVNDKNVECAINNGVIEVPLDDLDENILLQKIHFEDVGIIFEGDDTAEIYAPKTHYGAWLMAAAGILFIAFWAWRIHDKRRRAALKMESLSKMLAKPEKILPMLEETFKTEKKSDVSYKGKLVLYVTKIFEDENFEPREFNLLPVNEEKITLSYVLEKCGLVGIFPNAKYIFIRPDDREIHLENESDCTITKRNVIVEKGGSVKLFYNDSVNITSVDETAELVMIYKSLKPI